MSAMREDAADPWSIVAELRRERDEALAREAAMAEVLQVINSSPGDPTPVFDAILEKAHLVCGAAHGSLGVYDSDYRWRLLAARGYPEPVAERLRQGFAGLTNPVTRPLIDGARFVHIPDLAQIDHPIPQAVAKLGGFHTGLFLPLRKDGRLLGHISAARSEVRPFSEKQIALLENFAAQAVIAMENARLLTETREALEHQTATAEVLRVISSSPADLQPTFNAIAKAAATLCEAANAGLFRFDGSLIHFAAQYGVTAAQLDALRNTFPLPPGPGSVTARAIMARQVVHVPDLAADPQFSHPSLIQAGLRGSVSVPMLRAGEPIGAITVTRLESRSFTDKQIALLQNFAAQAVIAIENARLITETREALEQQTATAEVLQVINSSPGDLAPVFDAMLEKAMRLCDGSFGELRTYDGGRFRLAATYGVPTAYVRHYARGDRGIYGPGTGPARILAGEPVVHIADLIATEPYQRGDPDRVALVDLGGARAYVLVPLLKDATVLGYVMIYRKEVGAFSDKQITLLQNFAAQAVIAMENARLINETREALEQQTATAEVLQVINSSPGDLAAVFDAILEKAHILCGAAHGSLQLYDGENLRAVATHAVADEFAEVLRQGYRAADSPASRALIEGARFVQIADSAEIDHPVFRSAAELSGIRTVLFVPLRKDDAFLGLISAARLEVRPFSEKQIALLQNFAAQAVIAMENARLITETREA
jgi:two-component system, NtrC family, sensor kinase